MADLVIITATISATTSAVVLLEKIADQVERYITKSPAQSMQLFVH